jgi:hypothetical protein
MSARGARSRKVQQKQVEKKEKQEEKKVGKNKAIDTNYEPHDGFADWRATPSVNHPRYDVKRSATVSSRTTSRSSGTNDSHSRPRLNTLYSSDAHPPNSSAGGSASVSDVSTQGKEKAKFQAKGKETRAPRGRGGGVPIKTNVVPSPALSYRPESSAHSQSSPNHKTWMNFKVWDGGKDGTRPYGGFGHVRHLRALIV